MPFNDKKETLKDETYCIGTLSIDGETIEIFGGFKKENKEESRCCPKREACDLKRMESLGYLDPSTLTFPVEIHVNVDTGADISKISEDISKVLGKVVLHGD